MFKRIILALSILFMLIINTSNLAYSAKEEQFTKLTVVDLGTFNEYKYKLTSEFYDLRKVFDIEGVVSIQHATNIKKISKEGYNYLPDDLINKNLYSKLQTSLDRGIKYPNDDANYKAIIKDLENFISKTSVQKIKGKVEAFPLTGNAPMTVTLRGRVIDPSGTKIEPYNYVWWIDEAGKRKVIGKGLSLKYTFNEEGNFSVFLDVVSTHKNAKGFTDVLPFSSRADIVVKEKVASMIIKVNGTSLRQKSELKFLPEEASYGLLFDATSSTATSGTSFIKTTWDFGNGITKEYDGNPRVERVSYYKEGDFTVKLKLKTNELKTIERTFIVKINNPIATIVSSQDDGFLGDKYIFSAKNTGNDKNLNYNWEIIDLNKDKIILKKSGTLFNYNFKEKGKYSIRLLVNDPAEKDPDVDTKIIYINSRAPVASFKYSIPLKNKPNTVLLDATKSYDSDYSDEGKLKYSWLIDGNRVNLSNANYNGSIGYFTFDSVGDHGVVLEVVDPDNISSQQKLKININSILSVDLNIFPRVIQREKTIRFIADSPEAKVYEWDFGDGEKKGLQGDKISHKYDKSGVYRVTLKAIDVNDKENEISKNVYIGESDTPYAFINVLDGNSNSVIFDKNACGESGAYIVDRANTVTISGSESIDITGKTTGLSYSWKEGKDKYSTSSVITRKFDELGCFPIKLTVTSNQNGKTDVETVYLKVENIKPTLSTLKIDVVNEESDPVIVKLNAVGAKDKDGVIQSYLWYYYTDFDSEPQDFRATKIPNTSFVLPKITGNYYFVVVMKDNNEARSNSEDINGSKFFITLTGDNLNTPLVKLNVNNTSVLILDDVIFSADVENILGEDISNKVKYSWDFDGDGFYDKETTSNTVSYKYETSGKYHVKVKVNSKGFSSTKSVTINVTNILKPEFKYISIGNKYSFINTSKGKYKKIEWDLGDGTIIKDKNSFTHKYIDDKSIHYIKQKLTEGTKVKEVETKVIKNVRNILTARKKGIVLFSLPKIKQDKIILEKKGENVVVYLGENKGNIANYDIDYDINIDSDLNGGVDDDIDNKDDNSYFTGDSVIIKLNKNREQTVRLLLRDSSDNILYSKDLTIIKNYIEKSNLNINKINFKGVSENSKITIEKLKGLISKLPKEQRYSALLYIQKLQEEWFDNRSKTNVILEFEGFIDENNVSNGEEITNLLESLVVDGQQDKSEKAVIFNALNNLVPRNILCLDENLNKPNADSSNTLCYDSLISTLEAIKINEDINENRKLGSKILKNIAPDTNMTTKEKNDFKAILKTFIYGGVENIPKNEVKEVIKNDTSSSDIMSLLTKIFTIILFIIGGFLFIVILYYIYFLIVNKDDNIGFTDFIIEKTSGIKKKKVVNTNDDLDILNELNSDKEKEEDIKVLDKKENSNIFRSNEKQQKEYVEVKKEEVKDKNIETEFKKEEEKVNQPELEESVPDWLKGSFDKPKEQAENKPKEEVKKEEKIEEKRRSFKKDKNKNLKKKNIKEKLEENKEDIITKESLDDITKIEDEKIENKEDNIPDWLKGSFDNKKDTTEIKSEKETKEEVEKESKKEEIEEKSTKEESKEEDNIPDWLKGSFDNKKEETDNKEEETEIKSKEEIKEESEDKFKEKETKEVKTEMESSKKEEKNNINKVDKKTKKPRKKIIKKEIKEEKTGNITDNFKNHDLENEISLKENSDESIINDDIKTINDDKEDDELWDNGMIIPDWLKTDGVNKTDDK